MYWQLILVAWIIISLLLYCFWVFVSCKPIEILYYPSTPLTPDSTCITRFALPVPNSNLFLWQVFIFACVSSNHILIASHFFSHQAAYASSILAILYTVWYNWIISYTCCQMVLFIWQHHSTSVPNDSNILLCSIIDVTFHTHCAFTVWLVTFVVSTHILPDMVLLSSTCGSFQSIKIGGHIDLIISLVATVIACPIIMWC